MKANCVSPQAGFPTPKSGITRRRPPRGSHRADAEVLLFAPAKYFCEKRDEIERSVLTYTFAVGAKKRGNVSR